MVNHRNQKGLVEYEVGGNISFIRNEVTDLIEVASPSRSSVRHWRFGDLKSACPWRLLLRIRNSGIFKTDEEAAAYEALPNAQAGDVIFVIRTATAPSMPMTKP